MNIGKPKVEDQEKKKKDFNSKQFLGFQIPVPHFIFRVENKTEHVSTNLLNASKILLKNM